ncbi:UDP-Glycosyltransferase/glycogen phosphorylase, partial [Dendrothele bispora CBS 962.96]
VSFYPQFIDKVNGEVVTAVGVPPMYDYESHPQEIQAVGHILVQIARKYIADCNGMIVASSTAYDGKSIEAVKDWFTSLGQVVYPVGPLSLPDPPSGEKGKQVMEFLDKMQAKHGEKSVIYMSFGTFFWPKNPSKVWAVIEEILASGTPLVWAHPSPLCQVPEDKLKMLRESGITFETQWAPQEVILSHPATGWFISHGGWNSTQEAMIYKVPQVFWPQAADQPQNAATVCFNHKAGFELIEVRTGEHGTRLPYRFKDADPKDVPTFTVDAVRKEIRDVLQKLKGDEGLIVRKNFEKMSEEFYGGWEEGGEVRQNLNEFLEKFVDGN